MVCLSVGRASEHILLAAFRNRKLKFLVKIILDTPDNACKLQLAWSDTYVNLLDTKKSYIKSFFNI